MKHTCKVIRFGLLVVCLCVVTLWGDESQPAPHGIAHRGLTTESNPENTMPAFEAACKSKFWGVEYDVRQTYDKKLVICHDEDVSRTSDGSGLVYELKLKELQKLNFGEKIGMTDVRIPLFEEVFDLCLANGKMQVIEIKDGASLSDVEIYKTFRKFGIRDRVAEGKEVCDVVAAKIKEAHAEQTTRIGCFTIRILQYVHTFYPDIQTHLFIGEHNYTKYISLTKKGLSVSVKGGSDAEKCLKSVKSVGVKASYLTASIVKEFHDRGLLVDAWGIKDKAGYEKMKSFGVDSVTLEDEAILQ